MDKDLEIKYLREKLKLTTNMLRAYQYAFDSIKQEIMGWDKPLAKELETMQKEDSTALKIFRGERGSHGVDIKQT